MRCKVATSVVHQGNRYLENAKSVKIILCYRLYRGRAVFPGADAYDQDTQNLERIQMAANRSDQSNSLSLHTSYCLGDKASILARPWE